ncbi:ABC transporter permease subunit [[Mycoplasma] gypis]|uniref:ABC transporter permease n=1 Tax=[Mycoplasma] gypis TaxID=92404 RepID=A0ABZ2RRX0_9BACT|nr:ABC transporter permease [[Mycoplasma] gypis]MBN0919491.1 ABC transporter permease [[Mycoplasma] gypis]
MNKKINTKTNFWNFLTYYLKTKKSTIWLPVFSFVLTVVLGLIGLASKDLHTIKLIIIPSIVVSLFLCVLYSNLVSINIFKALELDGLELIVTSKPVSRKSMVQTKMIMFVLIGLIYSLTTLIAFAIGLSYLYKIESFYYTWIVVSSFFVSLFGYLFFGFITAIISTKSNKRLASTITTTLFLPLFLLGGFSSYFAEPTVKSFAKQLNNNYNNLNAFSFATDKDNDSFYVVNRKAQEDEKDFSKEINKLFDEIKNNAAPSQILAWLNIPYQMSIMFSPYGSDLFINGSNNKSHFLENIINYKNTNDLKYTYKLLDSKSLESFKNNSGFFIPNAPLIANNINFGDEKWNTNNIIYAWEKADSNYLLPQDSFGFSSTKNFAGKLDWNLIQEILLSSEFKQEFNNVFKESINSDMSVEEFNNKIFENRTSFISTLKSVFDTQTNAIEDYEKQIYVYVSSYYNLFFNYFGTKLQQTITKDYNYTDNQPKAKQYNVKVYISPSETRIYKIGGYSSYLPIVETLTKENADDNKENKQVARIKLTVDSNANLFSYNTDVFQVVRKQNAVSGYAVYPFWIVLVVVLGITVYELQKRKDFK